MTKNKERRQGGSPVPSGLLMVLSGMALGFFVGKDLIGVVDEVSFGGYLLHVIWLTAVLAAAFYLQTLLHEGGHMVCGLLSGYHFVSYRVGSWMVQKENGKLRWHRYTLAGTAGQCLLAPPDITDGKMPYKLYNAGGVLVNLLTALLAAWFAVLCRGHWMAQSFWEIFCVTGLGGALTNGIPMRVQGVANDGANARDLGKDPAALWAFWAQLKINQLQADGVSLRDMPEELFAVPSGAQDSMMLAAQATLRISRLMDEQRFAEAAQQIDTLDAAPTALLPLHHRMLLCDRLTCALLTGEDAAPFVRRWNSREVKAFRSQMRRYPAVLRTEFAVTLLVEKDAARAEKIRSQMEKALRSYPYAAEAAAEHALLQKLEAVNA